MQNKRAVIYCRVSTKEQVEEGNSLSTQQKICKEYAFKNGYDVLETFIEQGESAKTADRTEWNRLMLFCTSRKKAVDAVIAYKIDRISRNIYDYTQIKTILKRHGIEIRSTTEHFEDNPAGRFMENMIANVAQFDNDVRTERSVGGMKDAMRDGRYVWMAPIGYDNIRIGGRATITPNSQAPLIRKLFEEIAKNQTHIELIRRVVTEEGLVNKQGKPITKSYFYKLIHNEVYAGWIVKFGERHKGTFETVVTEGLFEQVKRVIKHGRRKRAFYQKENPDFPLRRFISHPMGKLLTGAWSGGKYRKYPYYMYRLSKMIFPRDEFEEGFANYFNEYGLPPQHFEKFVALVKENLITKTKDRRDQAKGLERTITELKEKETVLIHKNYEGTISDVVLKKQLDLLEVQLMQSYSTYQKLSEENFDIDYLDEFVTGFIQAPGSIWQSVSPEKKLELQEFNFPKGVVFDGVDYRTPETRNVLKLKSGFLGFGIPEVNARFSGANSSFLTDDKFWGEIALELKEISQILAGKKKKSKN